MPAVAADLHGLRVYALAFGAPLAASVVGMALAGAWVDGVGARRPLLVGVSLFVGGLLLCGAAPDIALFVLGRGVQGLGAGMETVSIYALVGSVVPEAQRPRVFAWFSAAWIVPGMAGPAVAGLLLHTAGWRAVFLVVPALAVPATAIVWPVVRGARTPGGTVARDVVRRRVLLAAGAGGSAALLQVAASRPERAWTAVAVLSLVAAVWCAARLLPRGVFRLARGVPAVVAGRGLLAAGFAGTETYLPLLLVREHGWDSAAAGAVLSAGTLTWTAGAWLQGRHPEPDLRYRLVRIGTATLATGVAAVVVAAVPGVPVLVAVLGWAVGGAGIGLAYSSTSLLVLHLSPVERHGEAGSALTTSESLTSAVALALAGGLFAAALPSDGAGPGGAVPYLLGLSVALLGAVLSIPAAHRMRPTPPHPG